MLLTVLRNDSNEINNPNRDREIERVITHDGDGDDDLQREQTV